MVLTETEMIEKLLNFNNNEDGTISTLSIAIRIARDLSGRDIETGEITPKDYLKREKDIQKKTLAGKRFLALASYLIIIDLIGSVFKDSTKEEKKDEFMHALEHFAKLEDKQRKSLKSLRNSLAHTFSLGNESEIFIVDYEKKSDKVIIPRIIDYSNNKKDNIKNREKTKTEENYTIAYFVSICQLVEDMYEKLKQLEIENNLSIRSNLKMGTTEFLENNINARFFIK
jgi:hypothetical protein